MLLASRHLALKTKDLPMQSNIRYLKSILLGALSLLMIQTAFSVTDPNVEKMSILGRIEGKDQIVISTSFTDFEGSTTETIRVLDLLSDKYIRTFKADKKNAATEVKNQLKNYLGKKKVINLNAVKYSGSLAISTFEATASGPRCLDRHDLDGLMYPPKGLEILDTSIIPARRIYIDKDNKVPSSRGCPLDYKLVETVNIPSVVKDNPSFLLTTIQMSFDGGPEGDDFDILHLFIATKI